MSVIDILSYSIGILVLISIILGHYYLKLFEERQHFRTRLLNLAQNPSLMLQPVKKLYLFNLKRQTILQKQFKKYHIEQSSPLQHIKQMFYKAGILLPIHYIGAILFFLTILGSFLIWKFFILSALFSFFISTAAIIGAVYLFISFRNAQYQTQLMTLLPHALDILIRGLKAGFSIEKTFITVAHEIPPPIGNEFKTICEQIAFGISFEDAVRGAAERLENSDFEFFVISLIIQRRTGGSLAELLVSIASTLRKRHEIKLKIKSLSGEAKATGLIVGSLPVIVAIGVTFSQPGYFHRFLSTPPGVKMLYIIAALFVSSIVIIKRLIKFDI